MDIPTNDFRIKILNSLRAGEDRIVFKEEIPNFECNTASLETKWEDILVYVKKVFPNANVKFDKVVDRNEWCCFLKTHSLRIVYYLDVLFDDFEKIHTDTEHVSLLVNPAINASTSNTSLDTPIDVPTNIGIHKTSEKKDNENYIMV